MRGAGAAILLLLLSLQGCISSPSALDVPKHAFLASDMTLANASENATHEVRAGSFFAAWAAGRDYPTWRAAPQAAGRVVQNVTSHVHLRASGPVLRTFRFPDVLVYVGSGEAWMGLGNATTPNVLQPGQDYAFDIDAAMPPGGLWLPPGEPLGVKVVPVMHQNDQADISIVTGGDDPSALRWTERVDPTTLRELPGGHDAGDVQGSAYAGAATPPTASHATRVPLSADARELVAWMNVTAHQGIPDLDLGVLSPEGKQLAYSGTPTGSEMVRLGPANLGGRSGDYRLVVTDYGSADASFSLDWRVG